MYFIGGLLLMGLGQLMLWKPQLIFELTESWKSRSPGEPSRAYLCSTRFGGVMMTLAGLGAVVMLFL